MNMVAHPTNFYEYRPHPLDDSTDILVEACKIAVQHIGGFGLGVENNM